MGLTRLSLRRPLTMLMIILTLVVMGYRAFTFLQLDLMPQVDFPIVTVVTVFPGASPEDIEELVLKPIEDAVSTISGIDELTSQASESVGLVIIQFIEEVDGDQAAIDVERQLATVQLPDEAEDPSVIKADINAFPILVMSFNGPQSQSALFEMAEQDLKPRLQTVPGVASISISGGREREVQVYIDPAKLAAYNLPMGAVQQALAANNISFPAGSLEMGRWKTTIRSVGEFTSLKEIENIVIIDQSKSFGQGGSSTGVGKVYLRDVATITAGLKDQDNFLRYNGRDAVSISTIKSSDANTVEVADDLRKVIAEINQDLPGGAQLVVVNDNSEFIREAVNAVIEDLILAVLITGLVMLVFLHTIRSTLIVMLSIPTSIISTFLVMWALGFSLNELTLLALTLVIGILVDDSIVVIENVDRHLTDYKKPPKQAALDGRREIGFAAITITLVDVVVYLPVAFMSGIVGQFFYSYGVTIAVAALFSLFIAFTLTPMLAGFLFKDKSQPASPPKGLSKVFGIIFRPVAWLWDLFTYIWEKGFSWLANFYGLTLRFFLWNPLTQLLAVAVAVAALLGGIYLVMGGYVGAEFYPQQDDGQLQISIEMPPGTTLMATDRVARQVENMVVSEVPEISSILTSVGGSSSGGFIGGSRASNQASVSVKLVDLALRDRSTTDVVNQIRPLLKKIPEATISVSLTSLFGADMGGSSIQVRVFGDDPDKLVELADQVETTIRTVPGAVDVKNTDAVRAPETRLEVNRDQAQALGLSPAQVAGTLRTALSGSQVGTYKPEGDTEIDITMRLNASARDNLDRLLQLPLSYANGQPIVLKRVVMVDDSLAPSRITRADRQRVLTVGSGVGEGRTSGDLTNDIEAAIKEQVQFPVGYGFKMVGMSEIQRESFSDLYSAISLAIVLVYILLVALYQSWLQPLAIMFSLPVTLVGAIGGLWLTGNTLNILSLLGIVLLTGVVTKNAILVVDFTNLLREEQGFERKEALVQAGRMRLRAVLMTTLTLVFALMPLLLGAGAGAEIRAPLAAVVIGGSISSTLLTLILVPVIYNFFDWGGGLVSQALRGVFGMPEPGEEPPLIVDRQPKPKPPARPASQPGAAISLTPSANPEPGSDVA
ncbi:MAG: efflux RND transporter permease subunit [Anaerolineae bacterium]|nr:efflux RND transporter permease subunit [Anaerolineae bacterium]